MPPRTREVIIEERRQLKAMYSELFDATAALLFRLDPIGINYDTNTDEYEPEVGTILPRLKDCRSEDDVCRVIHEEFARWFGDAGPQKNYKPIGAEL
ncbi:MAG: hypothetical protein ABUL66_01215, partial [Verrucomicrobiota bacterium]